MRPWAGVVKNRRRQTLSASTLADHLADGLQKIGWLDGFGQQSSRSPKLRATIGQCFVEQRRNDNNRRTTSGRKKASADSALFSGRQRLVFSRHFFENSGGILTQTPRT